MSIKIQMQDGQGNIIHPQTKAELVQYKDGDANSTLQALEDREELFISDSEPDKDGFWIDTTDIVSDENVTDENLIAKQIKKYINDNVITKYDEEINKLESTDTVLSNAISEIPNPNILTNGAFRINQKGKTEYTENNKYTVDRWKLINWDDDASKSKGKMVVHEDCIELTGAEGKQLFIQQYPDETLGYLVSGKTITLSLDVKVTNMTQGNIFIQCGRNYISNEQEEANDNIKKTFKNTEINDTWQRVSLSITMPERLQNFYILFGTFNASEDGYEIVNSDCSMFFKNVKLEVGDRATPFIPKTYAQELQDCVIYENDKVQIPYSNPNLLINSDFRNPVNQRGKSEYTEHNKYTIDRWRLCSGGQTGTLIKNDGYITLKNTTADNTYLQYMLDNDAKLLEGETITFSIMYKGTANCRLNAFGENDVLLTHTDSWTVKTLTIDLTSWTYSLGQVESSILLQFYDMDTQAFTEGNLDIKWVKLELGTSATPLISRSFGEELVLCQRYYEKSDSDTIIQGFKGGNDDYELEWKYLVEKRVSPTITYGNAGASAENNLYIITPNHMLHMPISAPNRISTKLVRFLTPKIDSDINSFGTSVQATGWFIADAEIY